MRSGDIQFTAERYIVAACNYSPLLLEDLGIRVPVRLATEYLLSSERPSAVAPFRVPIADADFHAVVVPPENVIRPGGTTEFTGYDLSLPEARIQSLVKLVSEVLPTWALDPGKANPWCGLRPMSVDGVPIVSRTPIGNLWINTGHGRLGWAMTGSPRVNPDAYALARCKRRRMR